MIREFFFFKGASDEVKNRFVIFLFLFPDIDFQIHASKLRKGLIGMNLFAVQYFIRVKLVCEISDFE
ncbi:hypothetical protein D3C80_1815530 [compost metagenome]